VHAADPGYGDPPRMRIEDQIDRISTRSPEAVAIVGPDATLTYRRLVSAANHMARLLVDRGVEPGDIIGIRAPRSAAFVVAALSIMKAGATYLPIDPAYPDARVHMILDDSRPSVMLCSQELPLSLPAPPDSREIDTVVIDIDPVAPMDAPKPAPSNRLDSRSDAAYVVFTSGSTGAPKGALIAHAGLTNLVNWHVSAFEVTDRDRTTQFASTGFDAAVWEIWPTLAAGASLHILDDDVRGDPLALRDWLVSERITISFVPTIMAEQLIDLPWPENTSLRFLLTGGGTLSRIPPADLPFRLVNNYGVSEATVVSTSGVVPPIPASPPPPQAGPPSIGREIDGVAVHILDEHQRPVEPGRPGELVISGVSVALGYLNRPELTADRFLPDPADPIGRLYRSGDLVRRRTDGEIEFLGRIDDQMNIRGFRVEPAEISSALLLHSGVRSSYILAAGARHDETIVAYLVPAAGGPPTDHELRAHLESLLPPYMVPSSFVWMDQLPLDPHGKVDRSALSSAPLGAGHEPQDDWSDTERIVGAMVRELLQREEVGLESNFFLLGGHSMLAAEMIIRLETELGVQLSLLTIFDGPSITEIAAEVDRITGRTGDAEGFGVEGFGVEGFGVEGFGVESFGPAVSASDSVSNLAPLRQR
jgi:amino acid adenylation domain-containing protein